MLTITPGAGLALNFFLKCKPIKCLAIIIAKINKNSLEIIQFLMSCRVIGRNFEYAMMDVLISEAIKHKLKKIIGIYKKTSKNHLVKNLYKLTSKYF